MNVLDQYFELSDKAGTDKTVFQQLVDCFSEDAVIKSARGNIINGKSEIEKFFQEFFSRSKDLRHIWNSFQENKKLRAEWAVIGRRPDGGLFSFVGEDHAEIDDDQKIKRLEIVFK